MARNWGLAETEEAENKIRNCLSDHVCYLFDIRICQSVKIDFTLRALRVLNLNLTLNICCWKFVAKASALWLGHVAFYLDDSRRKLVLVIRDEFFPRDSGLEKSKK